MIAPYSRETFFRNPTTPFAQVEPTYSISRIGSNSTQATVVILTDMRFPQIAAACYMPVHLFLDCGSELFIAHVVVIYVSTLSNLLRFSAASMTREIASSISGALMVTSCSVPGIMAVIV